MGAFGARAINRRLRVLVRNVRAEVEEALDEAAEDLLSRARQLAPQLSGELIGAGDIMRGLGRWVSSRVVFFDSPYAVVRHEDFYNLGPISSTKRSEDGTVGRKYLQQPFERHAARYQRMIEDAIRRGMRLSLR